MSVDEIVNELERLFPDAHCELNYHNDYELLIAIMLSAQTTDVAVNKVTKELFFAYPTLNALANASEKQVDECIKSIGLSKTKAHNIVTTSQIIVHDYQGMIPLEKENLIKLPGVGVKTANVFLAVSRGVNVFAVDTHVKRVARRLGLTNYDDPLKVEADLEKVFTGYNLVKLHHQFIFFGRYICKSAKPLCDTCKFKEFCQK